MRLEKLKITGGKRLEGTIVAAGAKNAMTKLLVASLLSDKKCFFSNVPNIGDVEITVDLCKEIGMDVQWDREKKEMEVHTKELRTSYIPQRFSGANRIPILMIGALLGRTSEDIIVPTVGGDDLGSRPVDFHLMSLESLGARIEYRKMKKEGAYFASAHQGLSSTHITLPYPSVGATENILLAASRAKGTTILQNAAIEPEVIELILFLQKLGVPITLDPDRTIRMEGTDIFYETTHRVLTDRNEVASYAMAAISTQGNVFIEGAEHRNMIAFLHQLKKIGAGYEIKPNGISFFYQGPLKGGHIETDVHPGFMTDWQQPLGVLLTQAEGTSIIHETVYENRFGYVQTLKEMGAKMELFTECLGSKNCRYRSKHHYHSLVIHGPSILTAKTFSIPDLRAGFAYVMAALLAKETSEIKNVHFLERGYEDVVKKLSALGADIEQVNLEDKKKVTV